ncbi:conserved hypothetical protein [Leishmania braziliensis MHOM/BR/75/M2904]|uniref:Uncharacterized protein n=2 Tax=Leishmania braziliensis TaxID=5660 RepID=A4HM92_LEIBR|nr:conserved hypothetical protein [Leishmania braziliensis MHOM/BR/75/M2904]CAJ2480069.1 unnamed protein product [Leishmania braziliensis]CAJ2480392.1 unnamed protein product [Leishmania braziliensis]CAM43276.1 conserved hypothetical protein [Leishmania braziliensis MHOM/BR/75/M2904]SYZ69345.1 hypothetical_protein [Leishmania braziliensis MHOM/BR/75/M2904]
MHASCPLVWIPHHLPALKAFGQAPVPHHISTPCALLRIHQRSASESGRAQHPCTDTAAAVVVAEWPSCPGHIATPSGSDNDCFFLCHCGRGPGVSSAAPPSNVTCCTHWVVLKMHRVLHTARAARVKIYPSGDGSCQQWMGWRLRLGTVLYASDWQFLVSQQERKTATVESCLDIDITGVKNEQTATADMEALSTFFPALHHGRYYPTAQAFVYHCRHSDEHLVWCEKDPLVSVVWEGAEGGKTEAATQHDAGSPIVKECDKAAAGYTSVVAPTNAQECQSRMGESRKRRRYWLSQLRRECPSTRARRNAVPSCMHRSSAEAATFSASASTAAVTSTTALDSICCAYLLTLKHPHNCLSESGERLVPTTAAAPANVQEQCSKSLHVSQSPLRSSSEDIEELLQSSSYASWYLALLPACRSALLVPHGTGAAATMSVGGAEKASHNDTRRRALQEVFLHGITASLALWLCKRSSGAFGSIEACALQQCELSPALFTASTGDATILVAALLRDWWNRLSQEATQYFSLSATAAQGGSQQRWNRCCIAHQVWTSLQTWDCVSNVRPAPDVAPPPAPLKHLCVACAIAVTSIQRSHEQVLWWNMPGPAMEPSREYADKAADCDASAGTWATQSAANGGAAETTGRSPSIDGVAPNMLYTPASCRLARMSANESRRWCDDYRACMDLVLQLLFAEQEQQLHRVPQAYREGWG